MLKLLIRGFKVREKKVGIKMNHVIAVNNLVKKFGNKKVIDNISFKVDKGEIFGLLGPSGAGKTTIIKMLTASLSPTKGEIKIFDTSPENYDENIYAKIGMVLDNSGLYERLTCYDNLLLFARIYHINKKRINEVLEKVELLEAINTPVKKLSKGMRQRLIIAMAIIHNPELLFLDEPTTGLDPATARKIHELLFELRAGGVTIFLTTHNMEEATIMCDNVALLNLGKFVEYGNPEAICRKYNKNNDIVIITKDSNVISIKNNPKNTEKIASYFKDNNVLSIHSSEPTLETVFIELTGKELI